MNYRCFISAILLPLVLLFSSCASNYYSKARPAYLAYFGGDYVRAVREIEKVKPSNKDVLLYLLDKGMILHAAGKYKKSNEALENAERASRILSAKSVSRQIAATIGNEEAARYSGEPHEIIMIPVLRMINYIMLDKWDDALVEVRRLQNISERLYGGTGETKNAFATYLSAIVWETLNHLNDALIDYKRMAKLNTSLPYYGRDIQFEAKKLGMRVKLPSRGSEAWKVSKNYRKKNLAQIILVIENGRSPRFISQTVDVGYLAASVPVVVGYGSNPQNAHIILDGMNAGNTYTFYDIGRDILSAAKRREKRSLVRNIIRATVQTGMFAASAELMNDDDTKNQIFGFVLGLLGVSMSAQTGADERSWRTLPRSFQVARLFVKPGKHNIALTVGGNKFFQREIDAKRDKISFVTAVIMRGGNTPHRLNSISTARTATKNKIVDVQRQMRANPRDGNLRIKLAYLNIQNGNYRMQGLLKSGARLGGNRKKAIFGLMMSNVMSGNYSKARACAKGINLSHYATAFGGLMGNLNNLPSSNDIKPACNSNVCHAFMEYVKGLIYEAKGNHPNAAKYFAKAYETDLHGRDVAQRAMKNLAACSKKFKKSKAGMNIVSDLASAIY